MRSGLAVVVCVALCATCSVYDSTMLGVGGARAVSAGGGDAGLGGLPSGGQPASAAAAGMPVAGSSGTLSAAGQGTANASAGGEGAAQQQPFELIDDMEDGDRNIRVSSARDGFWQSLNDGTSGAAQEPPPGQWTMAALEDPSAARPDSTYAARMHLTGYVGSGWGALMVASMRASGAAYDASEYCGIRFWAKRGQVAEALLVRIPDKYSSPAAGLCSETPKAAMSACHDDFHATLAVTSEWQEYTVDFDDLVQWGTGYPADDGKIDRASITGIAFYVDEAEDYELFIDDLGFLRNGHCP